MHSETLLEKFVRILMANVQARGLLKEIVRVHNLPAGSAEAIVEREAQLSRLCHLAQEELDAPPQFVKIPHRRWSFWPRTHRVQAK